MKIEWKEWSDSSWTDEEQDAAEQAVVQDLVASGRIIYGSHHQYMADGCPYVNGKPLGLSMRGWGRVMADARNITEKTDKYDYCDFAWYAP